MITQQPQTNTTKTEIDAIHFQSKKLTDDLVALVKGRKIRITSNWNGQPWGRSKPKKTGHVYTVRSGSLDPQWGIYLWLEGERLSIRENEVEWL